MTEHEMVKKKRRPRRSSENDGHSSIKRFPTLAHIVLNNGSRVEIPKLPSNISELTTYDHLRIGLEYAALATCWLNRADSASVPKLMLKSDWDNIRLNLEDLMNHLYYAIELCPRSKEPS